MPATLTTKICEALIHSAALAPSGDNTQPWRFKFDVEQSVIIIRVDPNRDPSPMNAGQRMSRIAVGAAVENLVRTATYNGWLTKCIMSSDGNRVTIQLTSQGREPIVEEEVLQHRCTNRRPYDRRNLSSGILEKLSANTSPFDGIHTNWITDRNHIECIAKIVGRADAIMFGEPSMRRAFFNNVQFESRNGNEVPHGLPLDALELPPARQPAFSLVSRIPNWLFHLARIGQMIGRESRNLVKSSSVICLVTAPDDEPSVDVLVGRAVEQAWLMITENGLYAQPMMSALVLQNALRHWIDRSRIDNKHTTRVISELRQFSDSDRRPAFLLRVGYAEPPTGRTKRRSLDSVIDLS